MENKRSDAIYTSNEGVWFFDEKMDKWIGIYICNIPPHEVIIKAQKKVDNADILKKGLA
jgi:hypothetical protein